MATRAIISATQIKFAKKGVDLALAHDDDDLVFRNSAGAQQPTQWKRGVTPKVGKNDEYNILLGENFTDGGISGWPLVFVQRLVQGSETEAGKGELPSTDWLVNHKTGSNKVTITNRGSASKFSYLILDLRIG